MIIDSASLEHAGVKGMKWGVRKKRTSKSSGDAQKTAKLRNRSPSELSDNQLRKANQRLTLERNYRMLNPSKVDRGRAKAQSVLATVGIAANVYNLVKSPAGRAAIDVGRRFVVGR